MKKNELIRLHALLTKVAQAFVEWGVATSADFESYRDVGVTAMSLDVPRADHERAVLVLARTLGDLATDAEAAEKAVSVG